MAERPVFIHIGLPKTATTTLQHHLFSRHPEILYLASHEKGGASASAVVVSDLIRLVCGRSASVRRDVGAELAELMNGGSGEERIILLSDEVFSGSRGRPIIEKASLLRSYLGEARIIMTIREPVAWIRSRYLQWLKGYGDKFGGYQSIDAWVRSHLDQGPSSEIVQELMVDDIVRAYERHFGEGTVTVLLFESMREDPEGFVDSICGHLGIEASGFRGVLTEHHSNKTLTYRDLLLKRLRVSVPPLHRMVMHPAVRPALRAVANAIMPKKAVANDMSEPVKKKVLDVAGGQYHGLAARLSLPLEEKGYRL